MTAQQATKPLLFFKDLIAASGACASNNDAVGKVRDLVDKHFPGFGTANYYDAEEYSARRVGKDQTAKETAAVRALLARWGLHVVEGVVKVPGDPPAPGAEHGLSDSGERVRYEGGGQREPQEGRGDFSLLPFEAVRDLAVHFEKGAKKYEAFNYRKGIPFCRLVSGAVRHLLQFAAGMNDEDHLAAAGCNVVMLLQMRADVAAGRLPATLDDRFVPPAGAP